MLMTRKFEDFNKIKYSAKPRRICGNVDNLSVLLRDFFTMNFKEIQFNLNLRILYRKTD